MLDFLLIKSRNFLIFKKRKRFSLAGILCMDFNKISEDESTYRALEGNS